MGKYTEQEEKEFNSELKKLQNRAKKLILSDYYDNVYLNEIQYSALRQLTNAESYKDVNSYLWSSGLIESTLEFISDEINKFRKKN